VSERRLSQDEYRLMGDVLREAAKHKKFAITIEIIKQIAFTGCKRSKIMGLR
jgi:negative regulator of sigma E activity